MLILAEAMMVPKVCESVFRLSNELCKYTNDRYKYKPISLTASLLSFHFLFFMNKYTLLGLVLISTTASFPVVHANQILFPSLEETFRQNEQRILSTYEERIS